MGRGRPTRRAGPGLDDRPQGRDAPRRARGRRRRPRRPSSAARSPARAACPSGIPNVPERRPPACGPRRSPRRRVSRRARPSRAPSTAASSDGDALERAGLRVAPERGDGGVEALGPADRASRLRVLSARRCVVRRHREGNGSARAIWPRCRRSAACACRGVPRRARRRPGRPRPRRRARRDGTATSPRCCAATSRARERFRRSVAVSHSGFFRDPEQFDALEQRVLPRLLEHTTPAAGLVGRAARTGSSCGRSRSSSTGSACSTARPARLRPPRGEPRRRPRGDLRRRRDHARAPGPRAVGAARPRPRRAAGRAASTSSCAATWPSTSSPATKARLHRMLAGALAPGGVLMLGRSERLGDPASLGLRRDRAPRLRAPAMSTPPRTSALAHPPARGRRRSCSACSRSSCSRC